jgi:hypothetical protein
MVLFYSSVIVTVVVAGSCSNRIAFVIDERF